MTATKYYVNTRTWMIHVVAAFPAPRGNGFTNCGQSLSRLDEISAKRAKSADYYERCLKCQQLTGEL